MQIPTGTASQRRHSNTALERLRAHVGHCGSGVGTSACDWGGLWPIRSSVEERARRGALYPADLLDRANAPAHCGIQDQRRMPERHRHERIVRAGHDVCLAVPEHEELEMPRVVYERVDI